MLVLVLSAGCEPNPESGPSVSDQGPTTLSSSSVDSLIKVANPAAPDGVREIEWDDLIPDDWRPDKILAELDATGLADDDPRAEALMAKLERFWKEAPVVPELDGARIKLPGFVVPLEMDAEQIDEFLLVPYYGACIHVPPPPANQTVYVVTDPGRAYSGELFDTVWVTGTIRIEATSSELGNAGYRLQAARVEPYE
jgi:hypothetical protein